MSRKSGFTTPAPTIPTSAVDLSPKIPDHPPVPDIDPDDPLQRRMQQLGIHEEDLVEKFIRGTGHGGQKINKTSSCVYLKHLPTGIEIKCQANRSQTVNREAARTELCDRIETANKERVLARQQRREKIRRRHRRPSPAKRKKNVVNKRRHGQKKLLRKRPGRED